MTRFSLNRIKKFGAATLVAAFFFSCSGEETAIPILESDSLKPTEISINSTILFSDSAKLQIKVTTPKMLRFNDKENPYVEFPEGLVLTLYDSQGVQESILKANYGINYPNEKRIIVKNDVEVTNSKNETLNTEQLTWMREEGRIFTEEYVKITTPDEIIYGDGLESNETFSKYQIKNIRGSISVNSDDEEKEDSKEEKDKK